MHDPSFLALDLRPIRLDVWHDEPGGYDTFTVCGLPPQHNPARLLWTLRHARHLHYRWRPYLRIRRWITDRCTGCGRRFLWKDARYSYQDTNKVWHDPCMSLRHTRGDLTDLTAYVRGTADSNTRWRVEYRFKGLDADRCKTNPTTNGQVPLAGILPASGWRCNTTERCFREDGHAGPHGFAGSPRRESL